MSPPHFLTSLSWKHLVPKSCPYSSWTLLLWNQTLDTSACAVTSLECGSRAPQPRGVNWPDFRGCLSPDKHIWSCLKSHVLFRDWKGLFHNTVLSFLKLQSLLGTETQAGFPSSGVFLKCTPLVSHLKSTCLSIRAKVIYCFQLQNLSLKLDWIIWVYLLIRSPDRQVRCCLLWQSRPKVACCRLVMKRLSYIYVPG